MGRARVKGCVRARSASTRLRKRERRCDVDRSEWPARRAVRGRQNACLLSGPILRASRAMARAGRSGAWRRGRASPGHPRSAGAPFATGSRLLSASPRRPVGGSQTPAEARARSSPDRLACSAAFVGPEPDQSPLPSWLIFAVATSSIMLRSVSGTGIGVQALSPSMKKMRPPELPSTLASAALSP